jgi:hypothetical protein
MQIMFMCSLFKLQEKLSLLCPFFSEEAACAAWHGTCALEETSHWIMDGGEEEGRMLQEKAHRMKTEREAHRMINKGEAHRLQETRSRHFNLGNIKKVLF